MNLLIFERSAESIEYDGIGGWEDQSIFLGGGVVEKERVFDFSIVVGDVFFDDGVLEGGGALLDFQTSVHFVTYNQCPAAAVKDSLNISSIPQNKLS